MSAPRNPDPRQQPYPLQVRHGQGRGVNDETTRIPQYNPAPAPPSAAPKKRRWPWIVGGFIGLFVLIGACGGAQDDQPPAAAPAAAPAVVEPAPTTEATPTEVPVTQVVLPEVEGRNGGIVYDELTELGLTNFDFATRDAEDTVVLLPQNWTAVSIEPGAGTEVDSDDTVIVTMTKEN